MRKKEGSATISNKFCHHFLLSPSALSCTFMRSPSCFTNGGEGSARERPALCPPTGGGPRRGHLPGRQRGGVRDGGERGREDAALGPNQSRGQLRPCAHRDADVHQPEQRRDRDRGAAEGQWDLRKLYVFVALSSRALSLGALCLCVLSLPTPPPSVPSSVENVW